MTRHFEELGMKLGVLVAEKNRAYGNSFFKAGAFLKLLYPDGIRPEQYTDMLCLVRIFDKQMRIATAKDALGESPYQDIAGYSLLGMALDGEPPVVPKPELPPVPPLAPRDACAQCGQPIVAGATYVRAGEGLLCGTCFAVRTNDARPDR